MAIASDKKFLEAILLANSEPVPLFITTSSERDVTCYWIPSADQKLQITCLLDQPDHPYYAEVVVDQVVRQVIQSAGTKHAHRPSTIQFEKLFFRRSSKKTDVYSGELRVETEKGWLLHYLIASCPNHCLFNPKRPYPL